MSIIVDGDLVNQGMKATGLTTRRAFVHHALQEFMRREKQKELLALKGKITWTGNLSLLRRGRQA